MFCDLSNARGNNLRLFIEKPRRRIAITFRWQTFNFYHFSIILIQFSEVLKSCWEWNYFQSIWDISVQSIRECRKLVQRERKSACSNVENNIDCIVAFKSDRGKLVFVSHACVEFSLFGANKHKAFGLWNRKKTWIRLVRFLARRKKNQLDAVKKSVTFQTCCEQELKLKRVMKIKKFT